MPNTLSEALPYKAKALPEFSSMKKTNKKIPFSMIILWSPEISSESKKSYQDGFINGCVYQDLSVFTHEIRGQTWPLLIKFSSLRLWSHSLLTGKYSLCLLHEIKTDIPFQNKFQNKIVSVDCGYSHIRTASVIETIVILNVPDRRG